MYGPLSPAFVAEELGCTSHEAARHLYGPHAAGFCWVSLADLAQLSAVKPVQLKRWVRRHHLQCAPQQGQGRSAPLYLHLDDARQFLALGAQTRGVTADALPRVTSEALAPSLAAQQVTQATTDVDWQLARQATWPMTVERLAEAVFASRAPSAQGRTRSLLRVWEAQGRVVCFARGLYDVVRPALVLDPGRYGRSVLARADLQKLRAHHPELAHWPSGPLAAAWRAYSHFYAQTLLPVMDRGEPTLLEYLLVRQLQPDELPGQVDARYEERCREAAFYRVIPAPAQSLPARAQPALTVENIEAGLINFKERAEATRLKMQRAFGTGQASGRGSRTAGSRDVRERA